MKPVICTVHGELIENQYFVEKREKCGKIISIRRCKLCRVQQRVSNAFGKKFCKNHGELTPELTRTHAPYCRLCHKTTANKKRDNNRAWFNEKMAQDRSLNPEKWDEIYKKGYEKQKIKYGNLLSLKKCCDARGITIEQYNQMHVEQKGLCVICNQPETRINSSNKKPGRLVIDHCHKTKKVRALLCHNCNTGIGKFFDDPVRIIRAARYVKQG
jgi:hypothetical protein